MRIVCFRMLAHQVQLVLLEGVAAGPEDERQGGVHQVEVLWRDVVVRPAADGHLLAAQPPQRVPAIEQSAASASAFW